MNIFIERVFPPSSLSVSLSRSVVPDMLLSDLEAMIRFDISRNSFFAFPPHRGGWPFSLLYSNDGFCERNNYFCVNDDNRAIITFTALRWYDITVVRY